MRNSILFLFLLPFLINASEYTYIHAPGYCAMYQECGSNSAGKLNCPYNGPALDIDTFDNPLQFRTQLVNYCGPAWEGVERVCCDSDILTTVEESMRIALPIISHCPACLENMKNLWCQQSCNPDQSMYINVTEIGLDPGGSGTEVVLATEYYVSEEYGSAFYDSCVETRFGASNAYAMDFIGGGAKDYREFLTYLGEMKFMGTPFPIVFPFDTIDPVFAPMLSVYHNCSEESDFKCACIDCSKSCPILAPLEPEKEPCMLGGIRCLSFSLIILYGLMIIVAITLLIYSYSSKTEEPEYEPLKQVQTEWKIYSLLQIFYFKLGYFVAIHPYIVITISIVFVAGCCTGLINFQVETDPVKLWVGPTSTSNEHKNFFDENFGPFYRTEQIIISRLDRGSIIDESILSRLFDIEAGVNNLAAEFNGEIITLQDICFKPLGPDDYCVIQSVTGYWQSNKTYFLNDPQGWETHFLECVNNPSYPGGDGSYECLPPFEDPLKPQIVLGGFPGTEYEEATALVVTFVVQNSLDESYIDACVAWEKIYVDFMKKIAADPANSDLRITFLSESGIELELARESASDLVIIAISYLVMFLYASMALGKFVSARRFFIDSKFSLGIAGVFICIMSVLVSVGLFSAFGVKTSLIIAEVIPFLVLAVGVDNIFILVHCFEKFDRKISAAERTAKALSEVGPSITLCALSETVAFGLGGIVGMPAVYNFAGFSAVAIFTDFILQVTCFVALLSLDAKRAEDQRLDCLPCISIGGEEEPIEYQEGFLDKLVSRYYVPFILHPITKVFVILFYIGLLIAAICFIPRIELGLDQKIALPSDSFLIDYFEDQTELLKVGVPVYFVIQGLNVTDTAGQKQMCAGFRDCDEYSIGNILVLESNRPEESMVALAPANWLDDFIKWLDPDLEQCCRVQRTSPDNFCPTSTPIGLQCVSCYNSRQYDALPVGPQGEDFLYYLNFFLQARPQAECALAGQAAYSTAVVPDSNSTTIKASHFRTYHTVLQTQEDFIEAYESALRICRDIEAEYPDATCFPYSIFYVFFEQYQNIVQVAVFLIIIASIAVMLVNWIILGSFIAAICVIIPVLMIIIDLLGLMAVWKISLNAVSLVNIVMALGISVEFCSHLTRAFRISEGTRQQRAEQALTGIGASVFSGITITKFFGVIVLAFANSEIFVVYYFRMYLGLVLFGFGHGLMFLPVILSYIGPISVKPVHIGTINYTDEEKTKELNRKDQRNALYGTLNE